MTLLLTLCLLRLRLPLIGHLSLNRCLGLGLRLSLTLSLRLALNLALNRSLLWLIRVVNLTCIRHLALRLPLGLLLLWLCLVLCRLLTTWGLWGWSRSSGIDCLGVLERRGISDSRRRLGPW